MNENPPFLKKIFIILFVVSTLSCVRESNFTNYSEKRKIIPGLIDSGSTDSLEMLINSEPVDSLRLQLIFDISYKYYLKNDSICFRDWNRLSEKLAQKQNDSSKIAEAYWDRGNFFYRNDQADSAYYYYSLAYKDYSHFQDDFYAARMLLNMAVVRVEHRDYTGGEVDLIRALETFEEKQKHLQLYLVYNTLGIIYNNVDEINNSRKYYSKAIEEAKILKDSSKLANIQNNTGVMWQDNKKYLASIQSFQSALQYKKLKNKNPEVFANIIDNLAYSYYKLGSSRQKYYSLSKRAKRIRDSISHRSGIIMSNIHFGEYSLTNGDTAKAINFFNKAVKDSKETDNFDHLLEAYRQLGKLNIQAAPKYFQEYVQLSDSLSKEERAVRNKFARIRFETDNYIHENKELSKQRLYILLLGLVISLGLIVAYIYRVQLSKTKEIKFEREQQKSNERIYDLLLRQHTRLEEGRREERSRISSELHDGILGKLFGIRMSLGFLKMKNVQDEKFDTYLKELQKIESEIRDISHDLVRSNSASDEGFFKVIEDYLFEIGNSTDLNIEIRKDELLQLEEFSSNKQIHIFRLIQEAVQNVLKHAEATKVRINLLDGEDSIIIRIIDNGKGFCNEDKKDGIGIKNMKNRISGLRGELKFVSGDKGTEVIFKIPKKEFENN